MINKSCNKCNVSKPLSEFHKKKASKDGLTNRCKSCDKEYAKNWYLNNSECIKELTKKRYIDNPEHQKEASKKWILNNPERKKEAENKWRYSKSGIYGIFKNEICLYVGQSTVLKQRISSHKCWIKKPHTAPPGYYDFYTQLNQRKITSISILEECSPTALLERETHYITQLKPLLNKHKNEN
jgi:hypothetical protein